MIAIFLGMLLFAKIFYPETIPVFLGIGQLYTGLNLWPIIILMLLMSALPKRRRK